MAIVGALLIHYLAVVCPSGVETMVEFDFARAVDVYHAHVIAVVECYL